VLLNGPSESKGFKSDAAKAVIELSIRDTTSKEGGVIIEYMRSELKSILESVISLNSYPKTLIGFQIFIIKKESEVQLFATCANALFTAINQAGLKCKLAPVTA
jgi:ribonuclease PH